MKIKHLFDSTTTRLTIWYMIILTALSLLFSVIVFSIATQELQRPFDRPHTANGIFYDVEFERIRSDREDIARASLVKNLLAFNLIVITAGGVSSYLLARRTLQPVEDALEAQTRFNSDVSHELRTPLAVMQSEIEIALRNKKTSAAARDTVLKSNLEEIHNLQALTERLLTLSSDKELPTTSIQLDEAVTEAINRVLPFALQKKITIENTVGKLQVTVNFEALTDSLVILLDNAIKYSPAKSQVKITATQQGRYVVLKVKDEGPGIDKTDLPHVFDRFYRADQSRSKSNVPGHGLGLSIAKRNIETMGGTIQVNSIPGKGSTFTVRLIQLVQSV